MTKQGTLEAKNLERMNASEQAPPSSSRDSEATCKELTLRNCSSENLNVPSNLSSTVKLQTTKSRWHDLLAGRLGYRGSQTRVMNVLGDVGCTSKSGRKSPNNQGSVDTTSHGDAAGRFNSSEISNVRNDLVCVTKPELLDGNSPNNNCNDVRETGNQLASSSGLQSSSCMRTKILSKSGITQYFVKDTLKDKGVFCRGPAPRGEFRDQSYPQASSSNKVDNSAPLNSYRGVVLQADASRHQNVSREIVRPPPHVIPNSGTLLNSNRETVVPPTQAIPNQVANSNRVTLRPPHSVIPNSGTLLNSNRETVMRPTHAIRPIPNQVTNLNRVTPTPPPRVTRLVTPLFTHVVPNPVRQSLPLRQAIPNLAGQTVTPLRQAIPNPGTLSNSSSETGMPPHAIPNPFPNSNTETDILHHDGVDLREWLKFGENKRNKVKSLHIFKQIVDVVSNSHSKGIVLLDLRPSYFELLQSNEVTYIGSNVQLENFSDQDSHHEPNYRSEKRPMEYSNIPNAKKMKPGENPKLVISEPQFPNKSGVAGANENSVKYIGPQHTGNVFRDKSNPKPVYVSESESDSRGVHMSDSSKLVLGSAKNTSDEVKWYASPEELNNGKCILSSNIYSLGILLVELLCSFDSERDRDVAMFNLRQSILPLDFLSGSPREAGFCLWLLHPDPSLRPSIREILKSDVIEKIEDLRNSSSSSNHEDIESDLLLHFLKTLQQQKLERSSKLVEEIKLLEADIEEVEKRRRKMSFLPEESFHERGEVSRQSSSEENCDKSAPFCNEERLMKNNDQLENVYFSMRSTVDSSNNAPVRCDVKELLGVQETSYHAKKDGELKKSTDGLGVFYNGLCKYARYTKFKVCGTLRNQNIHNSNIVFSLSFDSNEDYFAAAGVSKKIKIYDFHAILSNSDDIQFPVIELSNKSKLSCTSWNNYIRNYLASTDYDGLVKLWDAVTGKELCQYAEHDTRAWSVDFSQVRPTTLASVSDDRCVKLWDIKMKSSVMTIKKVANLCCVQFPANSHLIAFGGADYKAYVVDLRNATKPWCVLAGHARAVSYVKFLDSETLVSASIDNTLKIWDLSKTSTTAEANEGCISTLRGHTNEKSFVGLSVSDDGYIVCGSETNEVFAYHRSLPMPITSYKFDSINPLTGKETDEDDEHFVSSVCSQKKSEIVVAANSTGSMKLLQMV